MPVIRLFAAAREAAGTGRDVVEGETVDDVLDAAIARYGPQFEAVLATCRVWLNGAAVDGMTDVRGGDEVAVLPPVSGGWALATKRKAVWKGHEERDARKLSSRVRSQRSKYNQRITKKRLRVVYDVNGPRVRLGVLWF